MKKNRYLLGFIFTLLGILCHTMSKADTSKSLHFISYLKNKNCYIGVSDKINFKIKKVNINSPSRYLVFGLINNSECGELNTIKYYHLDNLPSKLKRGCTIDEIKSLHSIIGKLMQNDFCCYSEKFYLKKLTAFSCYIPSSNQSSNNNQREKILEVAEICNVNHTKTQNSKSNKCYIRIFFYKYSSNKCVYFNSFYPISNNISSFYSNTIFKDFSSLKSVRKYHIIKHSLHLSYFSLYKITKKIFSQTVSNISYRPFFKNKKQIKCNSIYHNKDLHLYFLYTISKYSNHNPMLVKAISSPKCFYRTNCRTFTTHDKLGFFSNNQLINNIKLESKKELFLPLSLLYYCYNLNKALYSIDINLKVGISNINKHIYGNSRKCIF